MPKTRTVVDSGAYTMTINVLRRHGLNEIADELSKTAIRQDVYSEDEIESLRANIKEKDEALQELQSKLAEAEKDAKLYQALKTIFARNNGLTWHFQGNGGLDPAIKDLDEAIKAAIS